VLAVAEGRVAVRSTDLPPYIEEVELEGDGLGKGVGVPGMTEGKGGAAEMKAR
jgi:hypothetical protein